MAMSLRSVTQGSILGLFILGMMFPTVGRKGALCGGFASLWIMSWIVIGMEWHIINKTLRYPHLPVSTENCPESFNQTFINTTPSTLDEQDEPMILFQISVMYLGLVGTLITVVVGLIVSISTGEWNSVKVKLDHITPLIQR